MIGGSFASLAPGVDSNWLLYSLVVVIIGGMGSLGGAAIGSLLLGLTTNFAAAYLPGELHVLLDHLHVRAARDRARRSAARALRATGVTRPRTTRRSRRRRRRARAVALIAPLSLNSYWVGHAADADAPARHRRREPDLPLGLRRHGLARAGGALRDRRLRGRQRDHERQHEGAEPRLEPVVGRRCSGSSIAVGFGARSSARSRAGASGSTS